MNLGAYWAAGMPLCAVLGFWLGWGVRGFWIGMAVTATVQVDTGTERNECFSETLVPDAMSKGSW